MDKKKLVVIILGITFMLVTGVLVFYLKFKSDLKKTSSNSEVPSPTISEVMTTWTDQSGFTFQYPASLTLDPHKEDDKNYAHLELTSASYSGNLIVWTKDTTAESIEDWAKQEKKDGFLDTTLGGESAKKVLTAGEPQKLTVTTIYGGYLYEIEVNPVDQVFWNKIFNQIISTFKFTASSEDVQSGSAIKNDTNPIQQSGTETINQGSDENPIEEEVIE